MRAPSGIHWPSRRWCSGWGKSIADVPKLSAKARAVLGEPSGILFRVARLWEMASRISLRKLTLRGTFGEFIPDTHATKRPRQLPRHAPTPKLGVLLCTPKEIDGIRLDLFISCQKRQVLDLRLRNENAIKRVLVVWR